MDIGLGVVDRYIGGRLYYQRVGGGALGRPGHQGDIGPHAVPRRASGVQMAVVIGIVAHEHDVAVVVPDQPRVHLLSGGGMDIDHGAGRDLLRGYLADALDPDVLGEGVVLVLK